MQAPACGHDVGQQRGDPLLCNACRRALPEDLVARVAWAFAQGDELDRIAARHAVQEYYNGNA